MPVNVYCDREALLKGGPELILARVNTGSRDGKLKEQALQAL